MAVTAISIRLVAMTACGAVAAQPAPPGRGPAPAAGIGPRERAFVRLGLACSAVIAMLATLLWA